MSDGTHHVTLKQMLEAMSHYPDETVFRWYQDSEVIPSKGWHQPTTTLVVTMGQVRQELRMTINPLGWISPDENEER